MLLEEIRNIVKLVLEGHGVLDKKIDDVKGMIGEVDEKVTDTRSAIREIGRKLDEHVRLPARA